MGFSKILNNNKSNIKMKEKVTVLQQLEDC